MKKLGLDIGTKTIGVAISDPTNLIAQAQNTILRTSSKEDVNAVIELIVANEIDTVVMGLPKNMNNTIGPMGEKVMTFHNQLKKKITYSDRLKDKEVELVLWDERLTTMAAERVLIEANVRRENRKKYIDNIAAQYILQSYLDLKNKENRNG
ncbi:MAG: Holliday junction resolvase RuvX [Clostridia bacterium]|nr:Holliday junction resolvase RuvX [Clostridia bacterium]